MGFTVEDMLLVSSDRYEMKLVAGKQGWSNSISWLLMLEDFTIIHNFRGKELAVTTGFGFQTEEKMLAFVACLYKHNASGLVVNTGCYIMDIPQSVLDYCDSHDVPLLTVPWEVYLADMIKDLSMRVFMQSTVDEQISNALLKAINNPGARELYEKDLLAYYDLDGTFQVALIYTGDLDTMDSVDRKRIAYRMQIYLTNLTHNGHFMYYDGYFMIIMNDLDKEECARILNSFAGRAALRMKDRKLVIGSSDQVKDISNLAVAFRRAKAAVRMALASEQGLRFFEDMGLYRLLYMVDDPELLRRLSEDRLRPLIEYDELHEGDYVATLKCYLKNNGSIKAMADELFIHRNTILYRMANIKSMLGCSLESAEDRMALMIACMILEM